MCVGETYFSSKSTISWGNQRITDFQRQNKHSCVLFYIHTTQEHTSQTNKQRGNKYVKSLTAQRRARINFLHWKKLNIVICINIRINVKQFGKLIRKIDKEVDEQGSKEN